ncbi:MAG: GTP-binding protein [Erysipelotrichaceae bacterium]|nr:GTP-binding protein [Erysipelotrichaceae bacterium]
MKVSIISGFLGAGKTTLISKLISEQLYKEKVVLIENEFGEIGIDGGFLKEAGIDIKEMNSGCICCSLQGDFKEALQKVIDTYHPEHIIIEPSGVGKLSDVAKAVKEIEDLKVNTLTTVIDCKKAVVYSKNFKEFYDDQIIHASCIILSRSQDVTQEKLEQVIALLRSKNAHAPIITTNWEELSANDILSVMDQTYTLKVKTSKQYDACEGEDCCCHHEHDHEHEECSCHHEHDHDHEECCCHHHHAEDVFKSVGFETVNKYDKFQLNAILSNLDDSILRCKGIVSGVDGNWWHFDYVPDEFEVRKGSSNYTGLITVIGKEFDEKKVKEIFGVK